MKVTTKTRCVFTMTYSFRGEVKIEYSPDSREPIPRVVEFPKVWREGGKQYKVCMCIYRHNGDYDDEVTIKAPKYTSVSGYGCRDTIEYY